MDRAALDRLYNNRAAVPGHQQDFARWTSLSEQTRSKLPLRRDIAYGPHPRETFDLFTVSEADRPLLVFIHGGYWQAMGKEDNSFVANGFAAPEADQIANVALLGYPLAPEADMDQIVASVRRALLWLWREAAPLGFDRNRIVVGGHSAGGHLALMAMLTEWQALDGAAPRDLVKGVASLSGLYDLLPISRCYLNDRLGLDEVVAIRNSPQYLLPSWRHIPAPMILAVGELETEGFHGQQHDFVKICQSVQGAVTEITAPGKHHFNIVDELARPGSAIHAAVAAWFG
ncbi:MAG TPA: alpha/beta hydrolase [Ferrovibrio sp.]|jgi:arylformamidase|uniref:alpha/beta hydrolase n=1 Tax=Ferrovibrio sp. TaxID=1917215 RepID=UPI002ED57857